MSWETPRVAGAIWGASLIIGNFKEVSMKTKRFFLFGLPAVLLALGLVLAGCDNGSTDSGGATATISGIPKIGETLTVTFSGFTPSAGDIYWVAASSPTGGSGDNISFGSNTYTISAAQVSVGDYIWVEASNDDHSIEVVSARVGPVTAAGSGGSPSVFINGIAKVGETLTATVSGFSGTPGYKWEISNSSDGPWSSSSLGGVSAQNTYIIDTSDVGKHIRMNAYSFEPIVDVYSNSVGPIQAAGSGSGSGATPTEFEFTGSQVSIRTDVTFPTWFSSNPASEGFTITVNGTTQTIERVFTSDYTKVYIDIEDAIPSGADVRVSYDGTGHFAGELKGFTNEKATGK
jgi:hypothetical protein